MSNNTFQSIKRDYNHFVFTWALSDVLVKGINYYKTITDDYIALAYANEQKRQQLLEEENPHTFCMYQPECVRDMLIAARELANLPFEELANGIVKADLWKAHPITWDRMSEIASKCIDKLMEDDEEEAKEYLREEVEMYEEAEYFELDLEEDEEEW